MVMGKRFNHNSATNVRRDLYKKSIRREPYPLALRAGRNRQIPTNGVWRERADYILKHWPQNGFVASLIKFYSERGFLSPKQFQKLDEIYREVQKRVDDRGNSWSTGT